MFRTRVSEIPAHFIRGTFRTHSCKDRGQPPLWSVCHGPCIRPATPLTRPLATPRDLCRVRRSVSTRVLARLQIGAPRLVFPPSAEHSRPALQQRSGSRPHLRSGHTSPCPHPQGQLPYSRFAGNRSLAEDVGKGQAGWTPPAFFSLPLDATVLLDGALRLPRLGGPSRASLHGTLSGLRSCSGPRGGRLNGSPACGAACAAQVFRPGKTALHSAPLRSFSSADKSALISFLTDIYRFFRLLRLNPWKVVTPCSVPRSLLV